MSLATRCSSCATVFRVVQDQLEVSEGWVRCGRCQAVFSALDGLFDLDREGPPESSGPSPVAATEAASVAATEAESVAPAEPALAADERARVDDAPAEVESHAPPVEVARSTDSEEDAPAADAEAVETVVDSGAVPLEGTLQPEFIRRAERQARWQGRPLRGLLLAGGVAAALLQVLQAGHHFRDSVAARWPAVRPALAAGCRLAGCAVEAPRRIDDIQLENTALARAVGMDAFVLSVQMRNRGPFTLVLPSVDLVLTDGNGRVVARRALSPRDFRAPAVITAGAEVPLQLTLATGKAQVAGYTVEIFYP